MPSFKSALAVALHVFGASRIRRPVRTIAGPLPIIGLVVPASARMTLPNIPHDTWDVIPFGKRSEHGRFQQVYSQSLFNQSIEITSLAFSLLGDAEFTADITIKLGHTTVGPATLSLPLDNNVTSALTTVFSDSAFAQHVIGGSETFGLVFNFSTPFLYQFSSGQNLLLDIYIAAKTAHSPSLGEQRVSMIPSIASPAVGRAYDMTGFVGVNEWGARTLFDFTSSSVSTEPATIAPFTLAFGWLPFSRRNKAA
jgi:hypothetical protein